MRYGKKRTERMQLIKGKSEMVADRFHSGLPLYDDYAILADVYI